MKRNLITTIKLSKNFIKIVCLEKISTNLVEIFNNTLWTIKPLEQSSFIKKSISEINEKIAGEIKSVIAIVESNKKTNLEVNIIDKKINLASSHVTKTDVENLIALAKKTSTIEGKEIILSQPIKFNLMDVTTKTYNKAPLNKKGHELGIRIAISTIASDVYRYVKDIITSSNLELLQIVTDTHTFAHETISGSALAEGAISLHTGMERTSVTINTNFATISILEFDLGYAKLIKAVSQKFNCSEEVASNLLRIHGNLNSKNNEVIFTSNRGIDIVSHTEKDLCKIIEQFVHKIATFTQAYIEKYESLKNLSITISGEITSIRNIIEFTKEIFSTEYVKMYKPLTFISLNIQNLETIATNNLIERYNNLIGRTFDTIVMTNPNSIEIFKNSKKSKFKIFMNNILGGIYERTK
ncbi:MAG: hypothetical protein GY679_02275 [Mycoplasma sp.]|nr:hypothetical protein [Mycoplasma sp.]